MVKVYMLTLVANQPATVEPTIRDAVVDLSDGDCIMAYQHAQSLCMLFRSELNLGEVAARLDPALPEEDRHFIATLEGDALFYRLGHVSAWLGNPLPGRSLRPLARTSAGPSTADSKPIPTRRNLAETG
jgi:hypothetical protein